MTLMPTLFDARRTHVALALALIALIAQPASVLGYQYWNDTRYSAPLPNDSVTIRVENPCAGGEENYLLWNEDGVQQIAMYSILDGPSTLQAEAPAPDADPRHYGFRLVSGDELDLMPVSVASDANPTPSDLTQLAPDAAGDELYGYENLDLVDCRVSFSDTQIHASLTNAGGGFPVVSGLTFFGYLLGIADPTQADPDTVFALMHTFEQAGIISPGVYKITGTGLGNLEKLGEVAVQEYPAANTLMLSCDLADLTSDPYFQSWYEPADPAIGVAGFTQRITLLGGAQEADRSPGGRMYLREFVIHPGANELPGISNALFQGEGASATARIDYLDADSNCPVVAEIVFDESDTFALYPQTLDYGASVAYVSEEGISPLASGDWTVSVFRFSDNESDVVEYLAPATSVEGDDWSHERDELAAVAFPNPFTPSTSVRLSMPSAGRAAVVVYDVSGSVVRRLADRMIGPGVEVLDWDGTDELGRALSSGVYFLRVATAEGRSVTTKLVLLR